ncbi:hypothetical protein C8Q75DRAFT_291204 [Abortiporus biennis]|nr:hypothetical protein C8Q75DRAFT_291204 [Abortiporus biennis]
MSNLFELALLNIFYRVFAIVYNALILILTWVKTFTLWREWRDLKHKRIMRNVSSNDLLLRDGTVYFVLLFALNVTTIQFNAFSSIPAITEVMSSILVSRFMLNLRDVKLPSDSQVSFIVGNLGAPLELENSHDARLELDLSNWDEIEPVDETSDDPLAAGLDASQTPDVLDDIDLEVGFVYDSDADNISPVELRGQEITQTNVV